MQDMYFNEHSIMKLKSDMEMVGSLPHNSLYVYSYGKYILITRLQNIKGLNCIHNTSGGNMVKNIEVKVSSIINEIYLDSFIKFKRIEENIPVFYNITGIIIDKEIVFDELTSISIVSNFMDINKRK